VKLRSSVERPRLQAQVRLALVLPHAAKPGAEPIQPIGEMLEPAAQGALGSGLQAWIEGRVHARTEVVEDGAPVTGLERAAHVLDEVRRRSHGILAADQRQRLVHGRVARRPTDEAVRIPCELSDASESPGRSCGRR
jgi:hypothetical protein